MNYTKYDIGDKELAYIAGFIDGEGCIQVTTKGTLSLVVVNTDIAPLQFIMDIFEGNVSISTRETERRKRAYRWSIKERDTPEVLKTLLPYLIVKRQEAVLAIEFSAVDDENRRLDIALELRALKHKRNY